MFPVNTRFFLQIEMVIQNEVLIQRMGKGNAMVQSSDQDFLSGKFWSHSASHSFVVVKNVIACGLSCSKGLGRTTCALDGGGENPQNLQAVVIVEVYIWVFP